MLTFLHEATGKGVICIVTRVYEYLNYQHNMHVVNILRGSINTKNNWALPKSPIKV